jgi:ribulose-5-phosphate 4-epimerase/fuculose-1-phosphate aldolase
MRKQIPADNQAELQRLLDFTGRVGRDPLLTQASTGNISAKLDDVLWMKASGKWMADATREDILIPLDLPKVVNECLRQGIDPAERYPGASLETAMHAALPHRVVLHVHCVSTIAWAVRKDAPSQLRSRLEGLRWQWLPHTASGLPLSREIEHAFSASSDTNVFVLGNHGLVIGGPDAKSVEDLLIEFRRRIDITPRQVPPLDYPVLAEICAGDSDWELPDSEEVHALGTDGISRAILAGGLLYPCQAVFAGSWTPGLFRPIPVREAGDGWLSRYSDRPFLIMDGRGVVINRSAGPAVRPDTPSCSSRPRTGAPGFAG